VGRYQGHEEGHTVEIRRTRRRALVTEREFDAPERVVWTVRGEKLARLEAYVGHRPVREALGIQRTV
jgi:ketosteroid isomerase-like protein